MARVADDMPWFACEYPERPYELGVTLWCGEPCTGCLISAEMQLNLRDPLDMTERELALWDQIITTLKEAS
jgi:hypothetical protein